MIDTCTPTSTALLRVRFGQILEDEILMIVPITNPGGFQNKPLVQPNHGTRLLASRSEWCIDYSRDKLYKSCIEPKNKQHSN